jgi:pimeloyl-ACP methyl ester carboxylesterase
MLDGLAIREWGDPDDPGVLLWPGLGSPGSYFAGIAAALPGRSVAVDPPGFGGSEALGTPAYGRVVDLARAAIDAHDCRAMVGHSLGANVAAGVAANPPPRLRAVVLIDGGYLSAAGLEDLGMPVRAGRERLTAWMEENLPRFPDWATARREITAMIGGQATPALEAYVREVMVERDGEIRDWDSAQRIADACLAGQVGDVPSLAASIKLPTLLIACGKPAERRAIREAAWEAFASASPLIELHVGEHWTHNPVLQAPEATGELVATWLRSRL